MPQNARLPLMLLALGALLAAETPAHARILLPEPKRYEFKIDPKTPLKDLLPEPPTVAPAPAPWLVKRLTETPEIEFQKPGVIKRLVHPKDARPNDREFALAEFTKALDKAQERTAHQIAKINLLNKDDGDRFIRLLIESRPDLGGLPFVMGSECRQGNKKAEAFLNAVNRIRKVQLQPRGKELSQDFWKRYVDFSIDGWIPGPHWTETVDPVTSSGIAALMQILAPMNKELHFGLVDHLATIKHADATRALARLAVFSAEEDIRKAATDALRKRPTAEATEVLLAGLRYPWPAVAKNAGEAIAALERKDLVPQLVAMLDEPDPRAPAERTVDGKKALTVREVVRLNHHTNCLLCHPPGNTPDVKLGIRGAALEVLTGAVPSPGFAIPPPSQGGFYSQGASPDILVRADVTYLRQDFSLLMKVEKADPWPAMQRFDFLVRTRAVTDKEAAEYKEWLAAQSSGYLAPHRQAALTALRALTGQDAAPTAAAWRKQLGI